MNLDFFLRPTVWLDDFITAGMANGAWRELHIEGDLFGHVASLELSIISHVTFLPV